MENVDRVNRTYPSQPTVETWLSKGILRRGPERAGSSSLDNRIGINYFYECSIDIHYRTAANDYQAL